MLIQTRVRAEQSEGLLEDIAYEIENGPHMMQILSGLYKNPVQAMVREYLTNMYDAHIALFKATGSWGETPTLVLPTALSPVIKFVDRGIGMTPDIIKRVYTKYGASSKNGSDDEVGGFGLGAKVAFTYNGGVDWTVESVRDGHKHTYVARLGKGDMPVLSHIASAECDEHSGTTVTIPINRGDISSVHEAARELLYFFPIAINVENGEMPNVPVPMYSGKTWKMWSSDHRTAGLSVVVGNVPYEIGDYDLQNDEISMYFFTRNSWVIHVPVGSVDIVPSRDNLKLTDRTKATVINALKAAAKEFAVAASSMFASCKTEWEARLALVNFNTVKYLDQIDLEFVWNGKKIIKGDGIDVDVKNFKGVTFRAFGLAESYTSKIYDVTYDAEFSIKVDGSTYIMINDVTKGEVRIVTAFASDKFVAKTSTGRAQRWGGHKVGKVILVTMPTAMTLGKLSEQLGGFPVSQMLKASSFKALKVPGTPKLSAENIYKWSGTSWSARVNIPNDGEVRYYLPLTQSNAGRWNYRDNKDFTKRQISTARRLLTGFGGTVYGIRDNEVKDFDASEWINIETALQEYADTFMAENEDDIKMWALYKGGLSRHHRITIQASSIMGATASLVAYAAKVEEVSKAVAKIEGMANDLTRVILGFHSNAVNMVHGMPNELDDMYDGIAAEFPLLGIMLEMTEGTGLYTRTTSIDSLKDEAKTHLLNYLAGG